MTDNNTSTTDFDDNDWFSSDEEEAITDDEIEYILDEAEYKISSRPINSMPDANSTSEPFTPNLISSVAPIAKTIPPAKPGMKSSGITLVAFGLLVSSFAVVSGVVVGSKYFSETQSSGISMNKAASRSFNYANSPIDSPVSVDGENITLSSQPPVYQIEDLPKEKVDDDAVNVAGYTPWEVDDTDYSKMREPDPPTQAKSKSQTWDPWSYNDNETNYAAFRTSKDDSSAPAADGTLENRIKDGLDNLRGISGGPQKTVVAAQTGSVSTPTASIEEGPALFDAVAARTTLNQQAAEASSCRKAGDPSGIAKVLVVFSDSGNVNQALVQGPPFAGTETGGCIARTMRRAKVPAFRNSSGSGPVTVSKTIVIQ